MRRTIGSVPALRELAIQRVRQRVRGVSAPGQRLVSALMLFMAAYLGFTFVVLGLYLPLFVGRMAPGAAPFALVDRHALSVLLALFFMRFLLQQTPGLSIRPYLTLPVSRSVLVGFFAASSIGSVHNFFPLLFAVPYAVRHLSAIDGWPGAIQWVAAVVALLLASNFLNLYLRTILQQRERLFLVMMAGLLVISLADEYFGVGMIGRFSTLFFGELHRSDPFYWFALIGIVLGTGMLAGGALLGALRSDPGESSPVRPTGRLHDLAERWDTAGHLIWLELRLMWRNRRPRHYLLVSLLFSTIYLVFMLASPVLFGEPIFGAVLGLFASGGFALNYGQLMFAWDSSYMHGMLARDLSPRALTRTKLIVLQASCLILFVVSLPLFVWLRADLLPMHVAFLFYNAGVTCQIVMELATRNRQRVSDLSRAGGFFNYEGFSARHWFWFLPTALPPTILLFLLRDRPQLAWSLLAFLGLVGLAATELWIRRHAARIERNKYAMLSGFAA